ncbi:hypothetical protein SLE2022_284970 [Rubroshorea leprosula]
MQRICLTIFLLAVLAFGQSDFEALLELKKGINQDPGKVLASWNSKSLESDGCPQNWFGVTCTDGHVTAISLNDVGLVGNFSFPVIVGLQNLRNISISNNQLTGTISNIGSIQSLEFLDLSGNVFYGLVPSGIAKLKNLVLLNLSSNNFEGAIPTGFDSLDGLKYLDLRANGFSGDIMNFLSHLGGVGHVDLSSNQFSGSLDLELGSSSFISSIQYLNISYNSLVGELFAHAEMPFFDSLEVFDASNNKLEGTIPSFNFVVSLRTLRLGSNQLSGSLPEALLQESSMVLSELDLSLNQLEGPVGSITSATLMKLNLSSNKLSGSLPIVVGHCAIIDLSNNMLSGNLSRIQSWGNYVEVIQLSSNSLTGTLPNQTSQFLRLTTLKVSNNSLEGVLPAVLGTYPELKAIDLSLNHLTGFLLPSFFMSTKLTDLNLSGNNFTGPIPLQDIPSEGSTQNFSLVTLDLSYNSLSGHLPRGIGRFRNLVSLNLSNNKLEGSIPDNLSVELKGFNVSYNNLSGAIPDNLRQFPDLAFHPGNYFLRFSFSPSSPKDSSNRNLRAPGSHLKPASKIALVAGLVGGTAILSLLCIMIYFRAYWRQNDHSKVIRGEKSVEHGVASAPSKSKDYPSSSLSFRQELLPSSEKGSAYYRGNSSSVVTEPQGFGHPESIRKDETLASPMSILSSSNPSPSRSQFPSGSPGTLKVHSPEKLTGDLHLFDGSPAFTAEELSRAPAEVIGRSCHGTLYKATLDSGHVLALKWLKEGIAKGKKEFAREVKKLGYIKHPNLVPLLGYYCGSRDHEKLVISNFINAECLTLYLQETEPRKLPPLSLDERLKIAMDVARCLNYLHNERAIPHGNLKSTNILLDTPDMTALLSDYSLHRVLTPAGTAEQVLNAGALGYRPPEFASSSKPCPSLKSDVYAYGVILLELLTGKSPGEIVPLQLGVVELTEWVRLLAAENRSSECFDKVILTRQNEKQARKTLDAMLQVALRCILPAPERPDMKSVFEDLSSIVP